MSSSKLEKCLGTLPKCRLWGNVVLHHQEFSSFSLDSFWRIFQPRSAETAAAAPKHFTNSSVFGIVILSEKNSLDTG